jgi:NAD(P) transhydrogenase subunit alpha
MKLAVLTERFPGELRVAASPDAVKKYRQAGFDVFIETGAGERSAIADSAFAEAGAVMADAAACLRDAHLLLAVRAPEAGIIAHLPQGAMLLGMLDPYALEPQLPVWTRQKLTTFAMELLPRISRAQGMDVLSSQSNLAGYRAVIDAVAALGKAVPMMMTAAGTVAPAKALVLGAGVAGLQAIATAKRLGAVVSAFDVRAAVKEQVQSLGAKFVEVPSEEKGDAAGGYAKEMSPEYQQRQRQLIHDTIVKQDFVICTALIPGRPAPVLVTEEMVRAMKPGSVIVDLAVASGGNCPLSEPDRVVEKHGVLLIGHTNMPARVAADASPLYARNLCNFVTALLVPEAKWDDELIKGTLLTRDGEKIHA